MNKYLKNTFGILIILIPTILLLGFLLRNLTKKSFYPQNGIEKISGIDSRVKVYSDDYGVPHIIAQDEKDMYFAMGYMHARDRLWQMDLERRVAEGRLSEIFGGLTLDFDKLFRTIGIDRFSYKLYNNISQKSKDILFSYCSGVNKFIETHENNLPVEFDALNYKPEAWKPEHSLMITRLMGWELNINWYSDYVMGEMLDKFGIEKLSEIFPDSNIIIYKKQKIEEDSTYKSEIQNPKSETNHKSEFKKKSEINKIENYDNPSQITKLASTFFEYNQSYRKFFNLDCSHAGSNSWVISGEKSETGKPLLANDPHLAFSAPSKWYEIQIMSNSFDAEGMSIPGAPGIIIGHNRVIAWGMTNLMNDDNDFYVLDKDSSNSNRYKYKNQILYFDSIVTHINVKDSNEVEYVLRSTLIGPVISDLKRMGLVEFGEDNKSYSNKILTFRWTGFENSDEIYSFYKINTAKNWDDFKNGLKDFGVPAQNFIYSDTNGDIGYYAAGKIPIRKLNNINDHIFLLNGEDEWLGFIDFDKLPQSYNPKDGYIVTANTNPFDWLKEENRNKYYISYNWEASSRFERISELLKNTSKINIDEFKLIQNNYTSPYARTISKYIVDAYNNEPIASTLTKSIVDQFRSWNGDISSRQSLASIYNVFLCYLLKNIFQDKMDNKLFNDFLTVGNFPYRTILILLNRDDHDSYWLNGNKNKIIKKSLDEALQFLSEKFNNSDPESWHWGEIHNVKFRHPMGNVPALDKTFNIGPYEVGGDQTTVNNSEYKFENAITKGEFNDVLGPSMRIIVDLSDISHSLTVNSTGQSGQPLHPNYSDQSRLWLFGEYKVTTMDEIDMLYEKYNLLILEP